MTCLGCLGKEKFSLELLVGLTDPLDGAARIINHVEAQTVEEKARHVAALRKLVRMTLPPPEKAEGDGVVFCGGFNVQSGKDYWTGIVVAVKMLREVSALSVQVWYDGRHERIAPGDLADIRGISYHDTNAAYPAPRWAKDPGWQQKTVALIHCGLRRVLYLDADAYPVRDPLPLLDLLRDGNGIAFWSDIPRGMSTVLWEWFGLPASMHEKFPTVQGGQIAFDRLAWWRGLVIAHWLNMHSDYFYLMQYGDQDSWRVALALTEVGR